MTDPYLPPEAAPAPEAPAARIPVRAPDGTIGTIDASEVDAASTRGYTPLTGHDLSVEQARPEFESPEGRAAAFSAGALRTISFGASDPLLIGAARMAGGDEAANSFRERLNLSGEINPGTETAGAAAGLLAPTGLAGLAGKGGKLASGAVRALAPGLAEGLAGRIGLRALESGVQGVGEGLAYGAGNVVSEDALGDHETTAEKLWAGAKKGALFGGLAGGVLGAGSQAGEEALASLAGRFGGRAEGIAGRVATDAENAALDESVAKQKTVSDILEPSNMGLPKGGAVTKGTDELANTLIERQTGQLRKDAVRHVYETEAKVGNIDDALDTANRELLGAANEALRVEETTLHKAAFGQGKTDYMTKLVDGSKWQEGLSAANDIRTMAAAKLESLGKIMGGDSANAMQKLEAAIDRYDAKMLGSQAMKMTNEDLAKSAYIYADQLKREIGKASNMGANPMFVKETHKELQELYKAILPRLEDPNAWGPKAAEAQKFINDATTTKLQTSSALRNKFLTQIESIGGEGKSRFGSDTMLGYLKGIGSSGLDDKKEILERWSSGLRMQLDAVEQHAGVGEVTKAEFDSARKALDKFDATMAKTAREAEVVNKAHAMKEAEHAVAIGGLLGMVSDPILRPIATARRLGQMRMAGNKVDNAISEGIEGFFTGKAGAAREPISHAEAARLMKETKEAVANPPALIERVSKAFTGISEAAPKVATFLSTKALQSMIWLADHTPRSTVPMSTLTPQLHKPVHSDAQTASFGRAYQAWDKPHGILEDMKNGAITREGVDYLKKNSPKIYTQIRNGMLEKLAVATEPLPYEKRMQLGILFGIDADPTLNAAFINAIQATKAPPAPTNDASQAMAGGSGRKGKPLDSKQYMTESERIAAQ